MHFLGIFQHSHKPKTVEDFDRLTCAEIPDPSQNKDLFEKVCSYMIHGKCGNFQFLNFHIQI